MICIEGVQLPKDCHDCDALGISDIVGIPCPCIEDPDRYDFEKRPKGCPLKTWSHILQGS